MLDTLMIQTYREIVYLNAMITSQTQLIYLLGWGSSSTPISQYYHPQKPHKPGLKAKLLLTPIYNLNQIINLYSTNQLTLEHIQVTFEGKAKLF